MATLIGFRGFLCVAIAAVWTLSGGASPADSLPLVTDFAPPFENLYYAGELAIEPCLQILRRRHRPQLLCLERAHQSALENNVYSPPRLGARRSLIVRIGILDMT
jgi:hypothetical protein